MKSASYFGHTALVAQWIEHPPPKGRLVYGKRNPHGELCGATFGNIEWQGLNRGIA